MSFINTRDTIGETAVVDGLVDHSLTNLADDSVYTINEYACYYNEALQTLKFPNVTTINSNAFSENENLVAVEIGHENSGSSLTIVNSVFYNSHKLTHLLIDHPTKGQLTAITAFQNTNIGSKLGAIYVPTDVVSSYKSATNWAEFFIFDKSEYPKVNFDIISDSWATILADTNPSAHYNIGDTKTLTLNGTDVVFQIAAFNADILASDSSKTALITWIAYTEYGKQAMHATNNYNGWADCDARSWLINDVLPLLEASDVGESLQTVTKTYKITNPSSETLSVSDKIWIPSIREAGFDTSVGAEDSGVQYSSLFSVGQTSADNYTRRRFKKDWGVVDWLTRTSQGTRAYKIINASGIVSNATYSYTQGNVIFGFCTGASS